jgi:hypothetical protein
MEAAGSDVIHKLDTKVTITNAAKVVLSVDAVMPSRLNSFFM